MEQTCLVAVSATVATYLRVTGPIPDLPAGLSIPRARCLPARMLDGAPATGSHVDQDPTLADTVEHERFGIRSYVSMPVVGPDGTLFGFLVGLDRSSLSVPVEALGVLRAIADSLGASDALRDRLRHAAADEVAGGDEADGDGAARRKAAAAAAGAHEPGTGTIGPGAGEPGAGTGEPVPPESAAGGPPAAAAGPAGGPPGEPAAPEPSAGEPAAGAPGPGGSGPPAAGPGGPEPGEAGPPGAGEPRRRPQPGAAPGAAGRAPTPETVARAIRPGRPGGPRPGPPRPGAARGPGAPPGPAAGPAVPTSGASDMRLRRAPAGWIVEGPGAEIRPVGDLISAMVLADLLAEDLSPPGRPRRADRDLSEIEQLRLSVIQLEHALASRVIVEQAIGVLAERNHIKPRDAFERLRRTARGMGRRVHDLARQVVDSVGDPRITLPGELGGRGGPGTLGGPSGGPVGGSGPGTPRPNPPRATPSRR